MRRFALAPLVLAALSIAPSAHANDVPKYGDLPAGRITTIPTAKIPAFIAARERAPGFFVAMPKFGPETPAAARHIAIVGEQKEADAIRNDEGRDQERELGTCFSETPMRGLEEDDPSRQEWSDLSREVDLWPKSKDNDSAGIRAVHSERVVVENGKVTLESLDAWVDPSTQGARAISRASLPLVQVGAAIGGVKVYAARDERDGTARFVQFVVVRPGTLATARAGAMMGMRQDGNGVHGGGCGHLRIALAIDAKNGDSAVVIAPVELPSTAPNPTAETEAPDDVTEVASRKAKPFIKGKRRHARPEAPVPIHMVEREIRTRDVQIHFSVSQATRDKEPLVAVSFGWASRESVQRITEEAAPASPPGSPQ